VFLETFCELPKPGSTSTDPRKLLDASFQMLWTNHRIIQSLFPTRNIITARSEIVKTLHGLKQKWHQKWHQWLVVTHRVCPGWQSGRGCSIPANRSVSECQTEGSVAQPSAQSVPGMSDSQSSSADDPTCQQTMPIKTWLFNLYSQLMQYYLKNTLNNFLSIHSLAYFPLANLSQAGTSQMLPCRKLY